MIELFFEHNSLLGEGPMIHPDSGILYWVDILDKKLNSLDIYARNHKEYSFDFMPGAVVPIENSKELLISFENGLAYFNIETEVLRYVLNYHLDKPNLRANDGKCDPFGNFYFGTMSKTCESEAGSLFVFDKAGNVNELMSKRTISNGLAWNTNLSKFYYIDSISDSIAEYSFDGENLPVFKKNCVYNPEFRYFDGMTIDTEGMLWVAHCTLGKIVRWNPETGQALAEYLLPAPKCTSLTFGGKNMSTLFITTAREHMTEKEIEQFPLSGSIFKLETGTQGFKTHTYKPIRIDEKI